MLQIFAKESENKMSFKMKLKIATDILMTAALLFLMSYELVGRSAHEWIGVAMFLLFVLHHILNRKWTAHLCKGKYSPFRILQTILAALIFVCMMGSMASGILLSEYVFSFVKVKGVANLARSVHMLCAYWGFVLMSLHLGLHWNMFLRMLDKNIKLPADRKKYIFRVLAAAIALYGDYAFLKRNIGSYLFLKMHFVFFDFTEPLVFFILDYMAVMGLFIVVGYYLGMVLKNHNKNSSDRHKTRRSN